MCLYTGDPIPILFSAENARSPNEPTRLVVFRSSEHPPNCFSVDNSDEVDEHFWARAAAEQTRVSGEGIDASQYLSCESAKTCINSTAQGDGAVPFNTQFFQDDDEFGGGFGGGFDDAYDGGEGGTAPVVGEDEDLQAAAQGQVRRVRPEFVNYAKRVKRVDVRKLKENIWKELDIVVPPQVVVFLSFPFFGCTDDAAFEG